MSAKKTKSTNGKLDKSSDPILERALKKLMIKSNAINKRNPQKSSVDPHDEHPELSHHSSANDMSAKKTKAPKRKPDKSSADIIKEAVKKITIERNAQKSSVDPHGHYPDLSRHISLLLDNKLKAQGNYYDEEKKAAESEVIDEEEAVLRLLEKEAESRFLNRAKQDDTPHRVVDAVEGYDHAAAASYILHHIKNDSIADLKKMFARIIRMREKHAKTQSQGIERGAFFSEALARFSKAHDGEDWKAWEFRDYAIEQSENYILTKPVPGKESSQWTEIYKKLGIDDRVSSPGKAFNTKGK